MPKLNHNSEFKPEDPKKDWGIDVGGDNTSKKAQLLDAEQNPEKVSDNEEALSDKENDVNTHQKINDEALWNTDVTDEDGGNQKKGAVLNFLKKKAPAGTVAALLISLVIVGMMYFVPAGVAFNLVELFNNFSDDSSSALHIKTRLMMENKMKNAFAESSDSKCNIKCKFGSVNENFIKNLKANGFEVESTKKSSGRYVIDSMKFPDGTTVKTGAEYKEAMKDTPRASSFSKVLNSKSAYFLNGRFGSILKTKFGLDKSAKLTSTAKDKTTGKETSTKDNVKNAFRKALGLPEIDVSVPNKQTDLEKIQANPKLKEATEKINAAGKKSLKLSNAANAMCSIYDLSKGMTFAVKTAKRAAVVAVTMAMFNAIHQAKAGDSDENLMAFIGDSFTQTDENGETVTSSPGYREAVYNETSVLSADDQKYSMTTSTEAIGALSAVTSLVAVGGVVAIANMNKLCIALNSTGAAALEVALECPDGIAFALATSAETLGIGAIIGFAKCVGTSIFKAIMLNAALNKLFGSITSIITKNDLPIIDETSKGSSLGNALFSGSSQILGGKAAGYGMKAGNVSQIKKYMTKTAAIRQQETTIAAYDARETPFDFNNQYSFAGTMVNNLGLVNFKNSSFANNITNLMAFLPRSIAELSNNTYAESDTKADLYDNKCSDSSLESIGVDADQFCNPSYVMSDSELDADINQNAQYMIDNGYINEDSGEVISGTDYQLYMDNCANRVEPLGETSASITEENYDWKVGLRCVESDDSSDTVAYNDTSNTKTDYSNNIRLSYSGEDPAKLASEVSNFRVYTMNKAISDTIDKPYETSSSSGTPAGATIDVANLYNDSTSIGCATGTTEVQASADGYTDGNLVKIKLCSIPNTTDSDSGVANEIVVNSRVSGAWLALINEMRTATGEAVIRAASSFRTMAMQEEDKATYGDGAAAPGFSNHQMGLAIDFETLYGASSWGKGEKPYYDFLSYNGGGAKYGFNQLSSEAWHWEPIH